MNPRSLGVVRVALLVAGICAGCALPPERGSPRLEIESVDARAFPELRLEVAVRDASGRPIHSLSTTEFHVARRPAGPLDRGLGLRTAEVAGSGRYLLHLLDGDLDPDRPERAFDLAYRREREPYDGAAVEVAYRVDPESVREVLAGEIDELLAEVDDRIARDDPDGARALGEAIARHAPGRFDLAAFDRARLERLLAADRDADAMDVAARTDRPEFLDVYLARIRSLLADRAERTALDWLDWLRDRRPDEPSVRALPGSLFVEHVRELLAAGESGRAAAYADALAEHAPEVAGRCRRLQAQAILRRALAVHSGRVESFPDFAAAVRQARRLAGDDPTLPAALAREVAALVAKEPQSLPALAETLAADPAFVHLALEGGPSPPAALVLPPLPDPPPDRLTTVPRPLPDGSTYREYLAPTPAGLVRLGLR